MKHLTILGSVWIVPLALSAQNWCPPGATWTYGLNGSWGEGYYQCIYAGDTLLGGLVGQNINQHQHIYYTDIDSLMDGPTAYYITTRRDTDIVWWWNDQQSWDTLYWFGAPGDKWLPPNYVGICPPYEWIEVVDTGTVIISGVPLRYCDVVQAGEFDTLYSRITERLGWEWEMNIWSPCHMDHGELGLRCYSDVEITWSDPDWGFGCYSMVGVDEVIDQPLSIFPNPGSDHFTIRLPSGTHGIVLYDMTGREVLRTRTTTTSFDVDTRELPSGAFSYRVSDAGGSAIARGTWVKN
ncbi:MAG TPA: T9SS type A sorting domain-containing protein [Flavobacteriales bacterium]|nr:T9SS type A sorting domain-containing protein [Flavobacteriales bacterium]